MLSVQDELFRKAVEQLSFLQSAHENDRISAEAFKVSVETIWGVLGGVLDTADFNDLMKDANAEVRSLHVEPRIRVLTRGKEELRIARSGERVRVIHVNDRHERIATFDVEDEAVSYARNVEATCRDKGFTPDA